jgi:hypothetical protein
VASERRGRFVETRLIRRSRMRIGIVLAAWVVGVGVAGVARADEPAKTEEAAKGQSIDFRKIKEWMPAELNGLKRSECNGERNKVGEMSVTQVTAEFKKGDDEGSPHIQVQVLDYNNLEFSKAAAAAWTLIEVDKESDGGFEKTLKIKGSPALLKWEKEQKHGNVSILVGGRYIVTVNTDNVPSEQVIKVAEGLALEKLAELK